AHRTLPRIVRHPRTSPAPSLAIRIRRRATSPSPIRRLRAPRDLVHLLRRSRCLLSTKSMQQSSRPSILVADDEDFVPSVLAMGLKQLGYAALQAASGAEAVELYRQHRPEIRLVLLDVRMPGMNGLETLAALQAINSSVVVCFLTGDSGEVSEEDL